MPKIGIEVQNTDLQFCELYYVVFWYEQLKLQNTSFARLVSVFVLTQESSRWAMLNGQIKPDSQNVIKEICPHESVEHHREYRRKNPIPPRPFREIVSSPAPLFAYNNRGWVKSPFMFDV